MGGSGLGNANGKSGNKGSNHNFEHRNLLSLGAIASFVGAGATEATLQLVLTAIQSGSEFEARLVEDAVSVTWLEVRTWNTSGGTWNPPLYYPAGSNTPGSPTLPVTYINNSSVLATIASNTTGLATEVTLGLIQAQTALLNFIGTALEVDVTSSVLPTGAATETTLAAINSKLNSLGQKASAASVPAVLSTEQEAILNGIAADLALIYTDLQLNTVATAAINTKLTATTRVPLLQRVAGAASSSVAAGKRSVSFYNAGPTDATVTTGVLKPGESISFDAGAQGDTLGAIPYITLATGDLVITSIA